MFNGWEFLLVKKRTRRDYGPLAYARTFSRPQTDFWNSPDSDQLNLLSETIVALVMVERRVPSDHNATNQTRSNASCFTMVRV